MKLHQLVAVVQLPHLIYSYNPFRGALATAQNDEPPSSLEFKFNPDELLASLSRKPEIFTKAMFELKRLEEEPTCHRVAVQLLMNNCQGLESMEDEDYQSDYGHLQKHHVESFSASLAICDLERGKFIIPQACDPFTSSTLYRIARDGKGKLQVSVEQVGACLEALGQNHSHWNTWLSYRDKALLFCRAARFDIDKDQAIQQHKKLLQIMNEFAEGLDIDLNRIRENMAEDRRTTDSYFGGIKTHLGDMRIEVKGIIKAMSNDITGFLMAVKSSLSNTEDLDRMLKTLFQTMAQGNAEMAAGQEQVLEVTMNYAKSQMQHLDVLAGETGATISELRASVHQLFPIIVSLTHRQNALDQRSEALYAAMANMTRLLRNHTEYLELASVTASDIHSSLEKVATSTGSWNDNLTWRDSFSNIPLRIGTPLTTLVLGNYGLAPSLSRNAALILGGLGLGEMLVQFRHVQSPWMKLWNHGLSAATVFTHLRREHIMQSPVMSSVDSLSSE